ncbi:MAG: helix-turn-helix domain-containing protein [Pseudoclavibacter sp.]
MQATRDSGLQLAGDAVDEWLHGVGWRAEHYSPKPQIRADRLQYGNFSMMRFWHTPARLTMDRDDDQQGLSHIALCLNGSYVFEEPHREEPLTQDAAALLTGRMPVVLRSEAAAALLVMSSPSYRFLPAGPTLQTSVFQPHRGAASALSAAMMASLSSPDSLEGQPFLDWRLGIENLASASLNIDIRALPEHLTDKQSQTLGLAMSIVEERAGDLSFSVGELVRRLQISSTHLHRSFALIGTTAGAYIREVRTQRALRDLRGMKRRDTSLDQVAVEFGFSSRRTLNRALKSNAGDSVENAQEFQERPPSRGLPDVLEERY